MIRVSTDCGLRLGEVLSLRHEDFDGETLQVRRTAHDGTPLTWPPAGQGCNTEAGCAWDIT